MARRIWHEEDIQDLKKMYPDHSTAEVADFLCRTLPSTYNMAAKLELKKSEQFLLSSLSGRLTGQQGNNSRFSSGHIPWNKGKSMEVVGRMAETQFKLGNLPHNTKEDGHISIRKDNNGRIYKFIRVAKSKWVHLHRHIWTQAHGEIPRGKIVAFKDQNPMNCCLENLELITRSENMKRNTIHRYPEELKDLIRVRSKLKKTIRHDTEQNG